MDAKRLLPDLGKLILGLESRLFMVHGKKRGIREK